MIELRETRIVPRKLPPQGERPSIAAAGKQKGEKQAIQTGENHGRPCWKKMVSREGSSASRETWDRLYRDTGET